MPPPLPPPFRPFRFRGHVLEDGLAALGSGGRVERQTKRRLVVMYTGAAGHEESGIDMGGLFKDFWTDLSALAFDVNYGLFRCVVVVVVAAPRRIPTKTCSHARAQRRS